MTFYRLIPGADSVCACFIPQRKNKTRSRPEGNSKLSTISDLKQLWDVFLPFIFPPSWSLDVFGSSNIQKKTNQLSSKLKSNTKHDISSWDELLMSPSKQAITKKPSQGIRNALNLDTYLSWRHFIRAGEPSLPRSGEQSRHLRLWHAAFSAKVPQNRPGTAGEKCNTDGSQLGRPISAASNSQENPPLRDPRCWCANSFVK